MENHLNIEFKEENQNFSVMYSNQNDNFVIILIAPLNGKAMFNQVSVVQNQLDEAGITDYDVVSFATLDNLNHWLAQMNSDYHNKGKNLDKVGLVPVRNHISADVKFYIDTTDGRDNEMIFTSFNRTYVYTKFYQMKYAAISGIPNIDTDFKIMVALANIIDEDWDLISDEVLDSFDIDSWEEENLIKNKNN
jgi:hypothetical protein